MQIEMHEKERGTLAEFAEKHGLVMEIHERTPQDMGRRWTESSRYYACFKSCDVKDGSILSGTFGNGSTPDAAMAEYAQEISEKRLVIDATSKGTRREIYAPILTHNVEITGEGPQGRSPC
jgi:hypothetical protein